MTTIRTRKAPKGFFLFVLPCLSLIQLLFTLSLTAQTASPPSDAQLDRDVQLLLANDDAVAELKRQVYAKEITNVEYTKQLPTLTAARNAIVKGYDRAGYQQLVALYNAAKKDKAAAAAAIKAQAAAEAKAKAAADKEAARQEAARVAAEKAAMAKAAAEAQAQQVAEDAQLAVKLQLRQLELGLKSFLGNLTAAEQREISGASAAVAEVAAKYTTGGALQARARDFQQQTNQLFQSQFPTAQRHWITDAFPSVDRIKADYSNAVQRDAALNYLANLLALKVGNPLPDFTDQKIRQYGGASDRSTFEKSSKLAKDPEFQIEVLKRYLPPLAADVERQVIVDRQIAVAQKAQERIAAKGRFLNWLLSLTMLGSIALMVYMSWRHQRTTAPAAKDPNDPLELPEHLRTVKVLRKEYPVEFEGGYVYEKEVWTETNVSTTTSGAGTYNNPVHTTTHVSTTVYHRYWMRTPDGKETWRRFSDNVFPAAKGNIISTISSGTDVLLAYNHTTGQFARLDPGINKANTFKGRWIILIPMGLCGVVTFLLTIVFSGDYVPGGRRNSNYVQASLIGMGVFGCIYILVMKIVYGLTRRQQFRSKYEPQFRKYMEQVTPELAKRLVNAGSVSKAD